MGQCLATPDDAVSSARARNRSTKEAKQRRGADSAIHERALAAALVGEMQRRQMKSASARDPSGKRQPADRRSSSASMADTPVLPRHLVNQKVVKLDGLEKVHFILVHGGGFGAWCWYKTIALLEDVGCRVTAIDLTGSGFHSIETNSITSLSQYVKPLTSFLENLADDEKVILVGHDFGGTCISYAMELFPHRISRAVFLAATMLTTGQSTLDIFSQLADPDDLVQQAQKFLYANGNTHPPTAIDFDKKLVNDLFFNKSSSKDVALASVSMRPLPFAPVSEKISLSSEKFGSVRRFYIATLEDNAIPITLQEKMIKESPPERVFHLKGADHSPFFSKPQTLHSLLVEISKIQ